MFLVAPANVICCYYYFFESIAVITMMLPFLSNYSSVNDRTTCSSRSSLSLLKWLPPDLGFVTLNFDVSVHHGKACIGFVIRDHFGNPHMAASKSIGDTNVLVAEATVSREGLHSAYIQ